ncbi:NAD(P)/FAD-dependent oxidoreductase [Virgibacillus xinjiangensis]|uniref:Ferredoxin--NADP reductase n=1 Tax=Virgibacillus xinjiangensis TaxID=393090 RepID=A0ABV7CT07_9BACI
MKELFDVTIIGGGPAGLYSAFYSGLRGMKTKILEAQPSLGGKVTLYPEKMIWDAGGQPPVTGAVFAKQLVEQALTFNPAVVLNRKVDFLEKDGNNQFVITTDDGSKHHSKSVILANGGGIITPKRLEIEGASRFEGNNLHYRMPSLKSLHNKVVMISGGGNAAIDWAVELVDIAEKVILVCRKGEAGAHEAQVEKLENSNAVILRNTVIRSLEGAGSHLDEAVLENVWTGEISKERVHHVLVHHGYHQDNSLDTSDNLPMERTEDGFYSGDAQGCTSQEGIFAAGDNISYEGKVNLLVGAFQDAVNAVNSAKNHIDPSAAATALVSSHNEQFDERNKQMIREMLGTV